MGEGHMVEQKKEEKGVKKLLQEFDVEIVPKEVEITEDIGSISEEIRGPGRPRLTGVEKIARAMERKEVKEREEKYRPPPRTPYVGGTPDLKDSGGWCLEESKTVTTIVDRRTGTKKISVNGLEVDVR